MAVDSSSVALAAGSILIADHVQTKIREQKRRDKMVRVISAKRSELASITAGPADAATTLTDVARDWDATQRRRLVVDLAFADPFAPYSLKFPKFAVEEALRDVAKLLGEPESLVDEIASVRKEALRSHRTNAWAKVGTYALLTGAVVASAGWAFAPVIGASLGASAGLSGAAATAFGLSLLGGGSLAAGGAGMAGGMWMVATTSAAIGAGFGGASSLAYQLGASEVQAEVVKLQVTFRVAVLLTQADLASALTIIEGLQTTRDELEEYLGAERTLNDENAARVTELAAKVTALSEAIEWMEFQRAEVEREPALTD